MAEWKAVTLEQDGARAWRVELQNETSDAKVVTGDPLSVEVEGGPVAVLGALSPEGAFYPLNDLQGASLTSKYNCVEGIAERVHAIQVRGTGTVTLYAVRRG